MLLRLLRIAGVLGMALAVCLAAGQSGGQTPKEGKAAEGKSEFRLVPPLTLQEEGQVNSVAYSPDGRLLASSNNRSAVHLWDPRTGKLLWRHRFEIRNAPMYEVAFSPDGRTLACAAAYGTVRLLDVATGKEVAVLRHAERYRVASVAFSPDGRWLVSGGMGLVVWDLQMRKRHMELLDPEKVEVGPVEFSADGKTIVSGSNDDRGDSNADWTVRIWDSGTGKERGRYGDRQGGEILSLRVSPRGKALACGSRALDPIQPTIVYATRLREVATGRETVKIPDPGYALAYSPDGDLLLVSGDGSHSPCRLWETATGTEVHTVARPFSYIRTVAFSPDGRAVALGTLHHTVIVQRLTPDLPSEKNERLKAEVLERLWADLGAEGPAKRYQTIWTLAAKPADAVLFLTDRLTRVLAANDRKVGQNAIRVLELIGTPEAREVLQRLATEAGESAVKQDAASSLNRLEARARIKPLTITPAEPDGEQH